MNTKSYSNLPDELLFKTFRLLSHVDIYEIQKVCRSWYKPAHLLLLEKVHLDNGDKVDLFLKSINKNPMYKKAVKQLRLNFDVEKLDHLERLFSSLTSINELTINERSLYNVSLCCQRYREKVPKLKRLNTTWPLLAGAYNDYRQLIEVLRPTLTNIQWFDGFTMEFLSSFPCLRELNLGDHDRNNFENWLPLFEQKLNLKVLSGVLMSEDKENFAERYMRLKTKEEQNTIIENLSKLETLNILERRSFSPYSIQFIHRYLKGIKEFRFEHSFGGWTKSKMDVFCTELLDFASQLQAYSIHIHDLDRLFLICCLPEIFLKLFDKKPTNIQYMGRTLKLHLLRNNNSDLFPFSRPIVSANLASLKINSFQIERIIELKFEADDGCTIDKIIDSLAYVTSNNITTFYFCFDFDCPSTYIALLRGILDTLPVVTNISLDIPIAIQHYLINRQTYTQVTHLELKTYEVITEADIFSALINMFPRIRHLKLGYFLGIWDKHTNTYEIPLQDTNLQRLYLELASFVYDKTKYFEGKMAKYFVLDVQNLAKNQRRLYKIMLGSLEIIRIDDADIEYFINNGDYVRVHITVNDLQYINMRMTKFNFTSEGKEVYRIPEATLSLI